MGKSTHPDIERAESVLAPLMPDRFSVIYEPEMPGPDGRLLKWFQVVFVVGPGDDAVLRAQVHDLFPKMLAALSALTSVRSADVVSVRTRRFQLHQDPIFDRPSMFIQADWSGAVVRQNRKQRDFLVWANECLAYRNYHDKGDIFNKQATV